MKPHRLTTFPWRIFYRFMVVQSVLVLVALAGSGLAARHFFRSQFLGQVRSQLQATLDNFAEKMPTPVPTGWCASSSSGGGMRLTLVRPDGTFLCDSENGETEGLGAQPEVERAFATGFGEDVRSSHIFSGEEFLGAVRLPGRGLVLRAAVPLSRLEQTMRVWDTSLGFVLVTIALILVACAAWSARLLVFPLGRLLLKTQGGGTQPFPEPPLPEDLSREWLDEWSELESNIDDMRRSLLAKSASLSMEQVELDTIMGAISDAILAVDPEGNPLFFNSRFELLFGQEGLRKRNVKLWSIFRDAEILGAFRAALKEGQRTAIKASPLPQKDGLKNYFSLSVSPLRRENGEIYGAVGIFHDVTELKSAEQMRIDFVANVSHELRTPLTAIKGYVDTLIQDVADGRQILPEFLQIVARNTERLLNLMNDLLDLSAIESTDILQKDPLSTLDVTERIVRQLEVNFQKKAQTVDWEIHAPIVVADPQRLEQVLVNLLGNAHKYTPAGSEIRVIWEPEGRDVLLKVKDTGPGIPVEHHARLFERFYRVDKARAREQGGTGLGLAIVKHIMQRHEGSIWVESRAGEGAVFVCRFPGPAAG